VERRYAILDDNQRTLADRLAELHRLIPIVVGSRVKATIVIGSVAEGRARDGSDLDLLLVLRDGSPRRSDYDWWDAEIQPRLPRSNRFPVQPIFVGEHSLATEEPHLRDALARGLSIWDPEGLLS